jgi:translation initiation factor 2-alpha kinase 4
VPRSPHRPAILTALLNQTADERIVRDLTYDPIATDTDQADELEPYLSTVTTRLQALFEKRGAVNMPTDLLMPIAELYETYGRRVVRLLDTDGTVLQLPYDLTVPLCRKVAREPDLGRLKRYAISQVYRPRPAGGARGL